MAPSTSDFDYELPPERIASVPAEPRDAARLLVLDRARGSLEHDRFASLPARLPPGGLLVLNETRVRPRRIVGRRGSGGRVEALIVAPLGEGKWRAFVRARGGLREGEEIEFEGGALRGRAAGRLAPGEVRIEFPGIDDLDAALDRLGRAPLPPYIARTRRKSEESLRELDLGRYQTVYAREPGAIAAPTAGLHFTEDLLGEIESRGIRIARITLHVGPGTFLPLRTEELGLHRIEPEWFRIGEETARAVGETRARGGRVVAVGTTSTRALETAAGEDRTVAAGEGWTDLFIHPPFRFRVVDGLVTNFHLPRSTLLALVCAFAGRERVLEAYREAVEKEYRFYSYGDAMLVL
ncbi:MAG TPA: tRNA preQ1(34) S-adenosylmethionine ribosyltransferase-isomerase QueA [Planctomycetota bacterium]|jgi:S-adenosylmethionine:tRNA ribosyltransferase-isomerase|nr:tRNA preQ1(34) S-adenosylmethionine ribosyltransferase-isomerase QueA [Planctomycetota bacterium]